MEQCNIYCVNTEKDVIGDILERNDKRIKVALVGTDMTIVLTRQVTSQPYIGFLSGLEFETFGEME
tara:strand:- start:2727 stop:2924 length:198 start_codon:yes stop_codon:yes gene_type:complete